ncbi:MAG: preprotein translocase subunit SecE [Pseudomonadota bacterium]
MAKTTPAQFVREVRQEVAKVTWPTRKETVLTTIMVLIMTVIAAIFFLLADAGMSRVVDWILRLGV